MMSTTVKVSTGTLHELEKIREELKTRSLEEAIKALMKRYRSEALNEIFGVDAGKIKPFSEKDRGEDR